MAFKGGKNVGADKLREIVWEGVPAFANAAGGVLIVGVSDQRATPPHEIQGIGHATPGYP